MIHEFKAATLQASPTFLFMGMNSHITSCLSFTPNKCDRLPTFHQYLPRSAADEVKNIQLGCLKLIYHLSDR
jgi:hypothetical protein